jgi:cytochrome oxidase assembly protein ShyY1
VSSPSRPGVARTKVPVRRWLGYLALVVVFAVACVLLSKWQFARLDEVRSQMARVSANYDATPVPVAEILQPGTVLSPADQWKPVMATGRFVPELQVLVRNRTNEGTAGFDVVSPLLTNEGVLFVVDRGWIPMAADGRSPSAIPALPVDPVTVIARLRPTEPVLTGQSDTAQLISTIHVVELAQKWGVSTYTGAYGLLASESPEGTNGVLAAKPDITEGNHLSYALQWLAFALLGFVALWWAIRNERRIKNGKPARPKRVRSRDDEAEDALLDAAEKRG